MGKKMISVGSVSRDEAALLLPFLTERYSGRRKEIRRITHTDPELVFWISPEGSFIDARDAHLKNPPDGFEYIVHDEPDYDGFLRGRVAHYADQQFVAAYVRPEALVDGPALAQFLSGSDEFPIPLSDDCLVISDNGDLYGTIDDLRDRSTDG